MYYIHQVYIWKGLTNLLDEKLPMKERINKNLLSRIYQCT